MVGVCGAGSERGHLSLGVMEGSKVRIRRASAADAADAARLLHDFNTEYDEPSPGVAALTETVGRLIEDGEIAVLFGGEGPDGIAVMRLRPALWASGQEAYLQELYVAPGLRRQGIGRALLEATMAAAREAGATRVDLNTGESDTEARALYESAGFTNREGSPDGPSMLFYERELD